MFFINDIIKEYFSKFLNMFDDSPYLGYKSKHVHNEPTDTYLFKIK